MVNNRALAAFTPYYDLGWKDQFLQTNCKSFVALVFKLAEKDALKRSKIPDDHILKPGFFISNILIGRRRTK
jgi:hypothetical protein